MWLNKYQLLFLFHCCCYYHYHFYSQLEIIIPQVEQLIGIAWVM